MTSTIVETTDPVAGRKRPQAIALPGQHAKRATKKINISANAGALVPFMAPPYPCIDAVPLAAIAPGRAEPSWIRERLLRELGFRADMEVRFIAQKAVTNTDLDTQQSRFRIPNDGVQHRLRGMLSDAELEAANLLHLKAPWPRPRKQPPAMIQARQGEQGGKRTRQKGRDHVGLPMVLVDARGRTKEMKLTQWDSSRSTVIHGDGYLEFMRQCGYEPEDVVEIWAFREKPFRLFGVNMCAESPLHVVIAYKEKQFVA